LRVHNRAMPQARTRANEVGSPSLSQLSLAAILRMFVAPVQRVISTLQADWLGFPRVWHRRETATPLRDCIAPAGITRGRNSPSGSGPLVRVPHEGAGEEWRHRRDLVLGAKSNDASLESCERPSVLTDRRASLGPHFGENRRTQDAMPSAPVERRKSPGETLARATSQHQKTRYQRNCVRAPTAT
jgi:hypothetical protein